MLPGTSAAPRTILAALLCIALAALSATSGAAATFVIDDDVDAPDASPGDGACASAGSGSCTLRAAIEEANALAGADEVVLPGGSYALTGPLYVSTDLTLSGDGPDATVLDAAGAASALSVGIGTIAIDGIAVVGASVSAIELAFWGVYTITETRVSDNAGIGVHCKRGQATFVGVEVLRNAAEGIRVSGCTLVVEDSVVAENGLRGVRVEEGLYSSSAALRTSEIRNNLGGGIAIYGLSTVFLEDSTVANNTAAEGGGVLVWSCAKLLATNSTISGNTAMGDGGGVLRAAYPCDVSHLSNTTVSNNVADADADGVGDGGGVVDLAVPGDYPFYVRNSILSGNDDRSAEAPDCLNTAVLTSGGFNLIGDSAGCALAGDPSTDQTDVDPQLGPLVANGGSTRTHLLPAGSPAVDAVPPGACTNAGGDPIEFDQRGVARPAGGSCDAGAYELAPERAVPALGTAGRVALGAVLAVIALALGRRGARRAAGR